MTCDGAARVTATASAGRAPADRGAHEWARCNDGGDATARAMTRVGARGSRHRATARAAAVVVASAFGVAAASAFGVAATSAAGAAAARATRERAGTGLVAVPGPATAAAGPCVGAVAMGATATVTEGSFSGASSRDASVRVRLACTHAGAASALPGAGVLVHATVTAGAQLAGPAGQATDAAGVATFAIRPRRAGAVAVTVAVVDPALLAPGQLCGPGSPLVTTTCTTRVVVDFVAQRPRVAAVPYRIPNPPRDLAPPPLVQSSGPCTVGASGTETCASPCYARGPQTPTPDAPGCMRLALAAVDRGRTAERLRPLVLPSGFARLGTGEQLFVLVNLERIVRGVPPLAGLVAPLDAAAQQGAARSRDPATRTSYGPVHVAVVGDVYGLGGTWAGGEPNALAAVRDWVYDDGWGGSRAATSNVDCSGPSAAGCWGHRMELLGRYSGTDCRTCVAGVGYAAALRSYTVLVVRPTSAPRLVFAWDAQVLRHLPAYERVAAPAGAGSSA